MQKHSALELKFKPSHHSIKNYNTISESTYECPSGLRKSRIIRLCGIFAVHQEVASIFFAILALTGNISQAIALPLWIDSAPTGNSSNPEDHPAIDVFFVPHFCSVIMFIVYASVIALIRTINSSAIGESEKNFPNSFLLTIGFCGGTAGIFSCFSSSVTRTPPYLQAILSNFVIPLTIFMRYLIIRKLPTRKKFICAVVIMFSLFLSLIPSILSDLNVPTEGEAISATARVIWPICYMIQFLPTTFVAVLFEKIMKARDLQTDKPVNLLYIYLWGSFYQMLFLTAMFWTDFIPGFGSVTTFKSFFEGYYFGMRCFVGLDGCTVESGIRACVLVTGMMLSVTGSAALVRHGEGATLLAIVMSLTSPLVFLFWSLFRDKPPDIVWDPTISKTIWFSVVALCIMIPAILVYNTAESPRQQQVLRCGDVWRVDLSDEKEKLILN